MNNFNTISFIEEKKAKANEKNLIDLKENGINSSWLLKKIENHLTRTLLPYTVEQVKEEILKNDLVASFFMKSSSRQNIPEKEIAELISKISTVNNFINYPSNIKLFMFNGKIISSHVDGVKSIDYYWETNNKKIYATQKYTSGSGGGQDNSHLEVIQFLLHSQSFKDGYSFAILDGSFYTENKIKKLKDKFETDNVKICNFIDLERTLEKIE